MSEAMNRIDAAVLVREAAIRLDSPQKNYLGGLFHAGGAYWRLAKVLNEFPEPILASVEGQERADFLIETHGRITRENATYPAPRAHRRALNPAEVRDLTELIVQAATYESNPNRLRKIIAPLITSAVKAAVEVVA